MCIRDRPEGVAIPGSLNNIFKEIHQDLGKPIPASGNLDRWVAQGVFPLNSVLTVRAHETGSHRNMGWEIFTDAVIRKLSEKRENLIFMLWGNYAKEKLSLIDTSKHLVLTIVHPSPLSAVYGFFGCNTSAKPMLFCVVRESVSYTHLDVYKRQGISSIVLKSDYLNTLPVRTTRVYYTCLLYTSSLATA